MNTIALGRQISRWRLAAGLTQEQLALRVGTKQSVISRVETGRSVPSIPFLERCATATGQKELTLQFGESGQGATREERRRRVATVLKGYVFDPWDRDPAPAEARTLIADGLTRERFQGSRASRAGQL
jgi:transcriptional regulator with XRE-family HTH domain